MNEAERSGLLNMRDCWISGGAAADLAPPDWKGVVAAAAMPERERLLLAIAGQALDVALRPAAPKTLTRHAPLPRLALPTVPDRLRPLFRAALSQVRDARGRMWVVRLTAARGFAAHPFDWMPVASDVDAPPVYAPWIDWQARGGGTADRDPERLNPENWDDFFPEPRRMALAELRRSDPGKARALLEAKAAGEAAETRLALIKVLYANLGPADLPYLQSLATDRSAKVRRLVAHMLARLGQAGTDDETAADVAELAEFIEQRREGLLRRRTVYTLRALNSHEQVRRRAELFENCQLIDLAGRLGASEGELIERWQLVGHGSTCELAGMVAESGSDDAVARLAERLLADGDARSLRHLAPRLDENARRRFVETVLAGDIYGLSVLYDTDEIAAGTFDRDVLVGSRLYEKIRARVPWHNDKGRRWTLDLDALGYLATASAAGIVVSDLVAAGLAPADKVLAFLRLNAALEDIKMERKT